MNAFTANDLVAADLLAPARHDDGAPATPLLAGDGQGCHTICLAGTGHTICLAGTGLVTASQAEMIAAAPGRNLISVRTPAGLGPWRKALPEAP
jgi:hypothetical protein